ncbi:MAG: PIG-L deacetylase family protein [Dehalococcoidia bacterium]
METPKRALVVTPHPDDAEFGCGGTVARWVREGAEVYYTLCTNGDKGSNDPTMTPQRLAQLREREQRDAAAVLGVKRVVMLRYPDGELEDTREFRLQLVVLIRRFKPDVVFCPDPFRRTFYLHRDHRICGQVTLDAVFPYARDRLHFPELLREGLHPHRVATMLLWGSEDPDTYIDITGLMETKVKALLCHRSQVSQRPDRDADAFLRQWAHEAGRKIGAQYAEAFRRVEFRR